MHIKKRIRVFFFESYIEYYLIDETNNVIKELGFYSPYTKQYIKT